ncbi:MAG: SRPBCC domain-containing protein, partial [Anaerolineales bacterium]|nr:SRPBCC domain-containing protein [Anaerolineales bacterium]
MTNEQNISCEITVPAAVPEVWQAWTTEAGVESFFSLKSKIDLRPGGAYEMFFNLKAKQGEQGGEGMIIMAIQPEKMLSFTWNAPPNLLQVRGHMTHV